MSRYRETLMDQWVNLYSDFDQDFELLKNRGKTPDNFNRWYKARIHRWKSITYSEGTLLEQVNNAEFAGKLQEAMEEFRFRVVEPEKERPVWTGVAAGVIAGGAAGGVLLFFHWGTAKAVIAGIAVWAVVTVGFRRSGVAWRKEEQKRVKEGYMGQLKDYGEVLMRLCAKYNV